MDLEEKTLSTRPVYSGKLLDVHRDEVLLSNGRASVREWIRHYGAAAVVPVFPDGTTLLVRQYRYPARRTFLEVPAGKLDHSDDDPLQVAMRELEEETGWNGGAWNKLGAFYPCIGYSSEVIHFFLATELTPGKRDTDDGEILETIRLEFDEALEMALNGRLDDMKTVLALRFANDVRARCP